MVLCYRMLDNPGWESQLAGGQAAAVRVPDLFTEQSDSTMALGIVIALLVGGQVRARAVLVPKFWFQHEMR
jgi:hypothetical protein